jgi:hypothetical protein
MLKFSNTPPPTPKSKKKKNFKQNVESWKEYSILQEKSQNQNFKNK